MNNTETLLLTIVVIAVTAAALAVILPYLKRKGVDTQKYINYGKDAIDTITGVYNVTKPFIIDTIDTAKFERIMSVAQVGVANVQQLYDSGQITDPAERKDAARKYIMDSLPLIGVELTPEVQRVIDGAIEAEVLNLGKKAEK